MQPQVKTPSIRELRACIPPRCFKPSGVKSSYYIARDLLLAAAIFRLMLFIPQINALSIRFTLWVTLGLAQGLVFTGIWILAHECGHGALFSSRHINDAVGFVLHSLLLVPFYSWKFTHARHHRHTNHMTRDTVFVPNRSKEITWQWQLRQKLGYAEDSPIVIFCSLIVHQLLGWPAYVLFYIRGGESNTPGPGRYRTRSHFDPTSTLFSSRERTHVVISNIGLLATFYLLWKASQSFGAWNLVLGYGIPYLCTNHWIVAITFLHHTDPDIHHYDKSTWSYVDGALSTVDRDFGWVGKHLFHGIIEYHMIHHLFPRIPFYHAEEATRAVAPLLGERYNFDNRGFHHALWETFRACQYVKEGECAGVFEWCTE